MVAAPTIRCAPAHFKIFDKDKTRDENEHKGTKRHTLSSTRALHHIHTHTHTSDLLLLCVVIFELKDIDG